jgi:hypothetical protein
MLLIYLPVFLASEVMLPLASEAAEPTLSSVSLAFACSDGTNVLDRLYLKSVSPAYDQSLAPNECADKKGMVTDIIPEKIEVVEHKNIGTWTVLILFGNRDSGRLASMTEHPAQQRYFLITGNKVLSASFLTQQIRREFGLDADSREEADRLKAIFLTVRDLDKRS